MKQPSLVLWMGRTIGVFMLCVLFWDIRTGGDFSATSRKMIMAVAAATYLGVFIKQCEIAWRYEGAPVTFPLPFRWVVAQWFGVTGFLIVWFLVVAVTPRVFSTTASSVLWGAFAQSTLFFFSRWLALGKPEIAGPGQTGTDQ